MSEKIIDRLYQYKDYKKLKEADLERLLGLSNGYLGKQKKRSAEGKGGIGESIIVKIIERIPEIDPVWLVKGVGEMLVEEEGKLSLDEQDCGRKDFSFLMDMIDKKDRLLNELSCNMGNLEREVEILKERSCRCKCKFRYVCKIHGLMFIMIVLLVIL